MLLKLLVGLLRWVLANFVSEPHQAFALWPAGGLLFRPLPHPLPYRNCGSTNSSHLVKQTKLRSQLSDLGGGFRLDVCMGMGMPIPIPSGIPWEFHRNHTGMGKVDRSLVEIGREMWMIWSTYLLTEVYLLISWSWTWLLSLHSLPPDNVNTATCSDIQN